MARERSVSNVCEVLALRHPSDPQSHSENETGER